MRALRRVAVGFFDSLRKLVPNTCFQHDFLGPKLGPSRTIHLKIGNQYMYFSNGSNLGPNICIFQYFLYVYWFPTFRVIFGF